MNDKTTGVLFLLGLMFLIWLNRTGKLSQLKTLFASGATSTSTTSTSTTSPTQSGTGVQPFQPPANLFPNGQNQPQTQQQIANSIWNQLFPGENPPVIGNDPGLPSVQGIGN